MSRQRNREEFISIMAQEGVPLNVSREFLRDVEGESNG